MRAKQESHRNCALLHSMTKGAQLLT